MNPTELLGIIMIIIATLGFTCIAVDQFRGDND
jgi:hypothetical protein